MTSNCKNRQCQKSIYNSELCKCAKRTQEEIDKTLSAMYQKAESKNNKKNPNHHNGLPVLK